MVGDIAERAGRAVGDALVERLGDPQVELRTTPRGEPVVERPAHELVGEPVSERVARHLLDHAARDGLVERRGERRRVDAPGLADHVGLELGAGDRRQLEHSPRPGLEPREPLVDHVAHALRRVEPVQRVGKVGAGPGGAGLDELAPQLRQQERIAAGQLEDRLGQRGQALEAAAGLADEVLDVVGREAREPQPRDLLVPAQVDERVAELLRHVGLGVAERRDDEQAGVGGGPPEVAQEQERRMVGPVPVLEDEQHRRVPAGRDQELDDRCVQPVALRVLVGCDGIGKVADAGGEIRQQPLQLAAAGPEVVAEAGRIDAANQPVERLGERPVRRRDDGVAGPVQDERAARGRLLGELTHEPALPGAGLTGDERDPPALAGRPRHERPQRRELARTAHERERGRQTKRPRKGRLCGQVGH
jgi:hypothetical protein